MMPLLDEQSFTLFFFFKQKKSGFVSWQLFAVSVCNFWETALTSPPLSRVLQ